MQGTSTHSIIVVRVSEVCTPHVPGAAMLVDYGSFGFEKYSARNVKIGKLIEMNELYEVMCK